MQAPFVDPSLTLEQLTASLPLMGREGEIQLLHNLLDTVSGEQPGARVLTINGEIGVGKTRLLAELYEAARRRSFTVLEASAYEASRLFPYFPFIEALRPVLSSASPEQLRRYVGLAAIAGDYTLLPITQQARTLSRLFPELLSRLHLKTERGTQELLTPAQEKFRLLDAIATLLERMALEQPVLLSIDNLQWADNASLELMLYLTVRLRTSRVALVGTTRPPRVSNDLETTTNAATKALAELVHNGLLLLLPLGPLDEVAASQHLRNILPGHIEPDAVHTLLERSEGNPFFLEELVRALTFSRQLVLRGGTWSIARPGSLKLPESIVLAVKLRLQGLSADSLDLLSTAALFGRIFPVEPLARVLEQSENKLSLLLEETLQASIIAPYEPEEGENPGREWSRESEFQCYLFCQSIVQEVLQMAVSPQQRRLLHGAIGKALEVGYGTEAGSHAAELARHYAQSNEHEAALHWSLLAGEEAMRQQAQREAINHFLRAIKLLTTRENSEASLTELHLTIGSLWSTLGELEQALRSFQQALEGLQRIEEPPPLLQARANRLISDAYRMQARYELARAHLQAASAAFERLKQHKEHAEQVFSLFPPSEQVGTAEQILFLQSRALLSLMLNQPNEAEQALWQSHSIATTIGDRNDQAFAMHMIGWTLGWGDRIHEAIRLLKGANDLYIAIGDPFRATLGDQALGSIYQVTGDMKLARQYTEQGLERTRRYALRPALGLLYWNQGTMALHQGDWENGAAYLQQALREAHATSNARLKPLVLQALAELQFKQGNWQEAEQFFLEAIQAGTDTEWRVSTLALYGHFLAVTGRKTLALAQLDRAAALPEPPGISGHFYLPFLAEGYLDTGKQVASYIAHLRSLRGFTYYGTSVDRVLGAIAAHVNDWDTAEQAFEEGLLHCQRSGNQPEEGAI
ncbi:MAG: AAA family ATPase, partial [Ktedonobacteraceae bacterium]|nr:AAA family ATPase [Ktedonobacteraceae bacterium]